MMTPKHTIIIAEAGVNHNGSIDRAVELIDEAVNAGVDFIKFQTFKADKLVSGNAKKAKYQEINDQSSGSQYEMLKKLELSESDHYLLIKRCKEKRIGFLSSAFDPESLEFIAKLDMAFFKVPSGELTNIPYLKRIASFGKKVILSTGMAEMGEIEQAILLFEKENLTKENLIVLHCNSQYPTPFEDVNLKAMLSIQDRFNVSVGYSDHTLGIAIPIAAAALGAVLIEKHFTLDKNLPGPDHKASLEPSELQAMVKAIRNVDQALGDGEKKPSKSEKENIEIVRKSVHLTRNMEAGEIIQLSDICLKRPATGLPPSMYEYIPGKKLLKSKKADEPLLGEDILN